MNIGKKVSVVFIITFFVVCLFGNFVNASGETAYDISEYIIDATIMENGNLHVVEKIAFDFDESANGIYRDVMYKYNFSSQEDSMEPTSSRYQATDVTNIHVSQTDSQYNEVNTFTSINESYASNGMKNVFSLSDLLDDGYTKRIKMYIPSSSGETKYMKIEYDIEDVAVLYNDKGEIYWNFVGGGWDCSIRNLKINIDFDGYGDEDIKFYPHTYAKIENITNKNEKLSFEVKRLSAGIAADARVVFSNEYLDEIFVTKKVYENYDLEQLNNIEADMVKGKERYNISNRMVFLIITITIIYFIILIVKANKISSKGKAKKIEYYTKPLENLSLPVYMKLNGGTVLASNLLIATTLDLQQKKILKMDARKKLKKSFDGIEYDYYLSIYENADCTKLNNYERLVLNYLFNQKAQFEITGFEEVTIELNERFKELSKNYNEVSKFNKLCAVYDKKIHEVLFEKADKNLKRFSLVSVLIIVILSLVNNFIISPLNADLKMENFIVYFVFGTILSMFVVLLTYVRSIKSDYYEEYNKFKGLEKYLKEYSLIKDRYPIEIALWDRYLVFATLFGIAKKVAKEFKEELIKNGYDDDYIYTNYPVISMSMYSSQMSSYASSSSGGSSGGGSGGGGRRRRWRWFFLEPNRIKIYNV